MSQIKGGSNLLSALLSIHRQNPRLIASPPLSTENPGASRRASVAIIIRLRPNLSSPNSSPPSFPSTADTSPLPTQILLGPSPPTSPSQDLSSSTSNAFQPPPIKSVPTQLEEFFDQDWVKHEGTVAEILFIKRATRSGDRWNGHVAFPGGKSEADDEDGKYTAMRETWEEVGIDLAEKEWLSIGQLDDREITTSLGKRLLMILSPFVFLHTSRYGPIPELQETEVASAHWIPLDLLHAPKAKYGRVGIDISTRLAPKNAVARFALRLLIGRMHFKCILLPNDPCAIGQVQPPPAKGEEERPELKLWGLTLGMTLDLLSSITLPSSSSSSLSTALPHSPSLNSSANPASLSTYPHAISTIDSPPLAPSVASIFPTFSFPDINLLIWVFGWRYRRLLAHSQRRAQSIRRAQSLPDSSSSSTPGSKTEEESEESKLILAEISDPRVNWAGMSLGLFYSAVRRALVVAVVLRALAAAVGVGWVGWSVRKWFLERKSLGGGGGRKLLGRA